MTTPPSQKRFQRGVICVWVATILTGYILGIRHICTNQFPTGDEIFYGGPARGLSESDVDAFQNMRTTEKDSYDAGLLYVGGVSTLALIGSVVAGALAWLRRRRANLHNADGNIRDRHRPP